MRYFVTGANGMLGKAVMEELAEIQVEAIGFTHIQCPIDNMDAVEHAMRNASSDDVIINCAGVRPGGDKVAMVNTNAVGPKVLSDFVGQKHIPLVHVSTDCVFSGRVGNYSPTDHPSPIDMYGRSKAQGEKIFYSYYPAYLVTVVRTSFIGLDHGLLHWYINEMEAGRRIEGWQNAIWSGSTVWEVARALIRIAYYKLGDIQHLATKEPISKYDLLVAIALELGFDTGRIKRTKQPAINRSLVPTIELAPIKNTLNELKEKVDESWLTATSR